MLQWNEQSSAGSCSFLNIFFTILQTLFLCGLEYFSFPVHNFSCLIAISNVKSTSRCFPIQHSHSLEFCSRWKDDFELILKKILSCIKFVSINFSIGSLIVYQSFKQSYKTIILNISLKFQSNFEKNLIFCTYLLLKNYQNFGSDKPKNDQFTQCCAVIQANVISCTFLYNVQFSEAYSNEEDRSTWKMQITLLIGNCT